MDDTTVDALIRMLGTSIGESVADEVVRREVKALGFGSHLTSREVETLLERIEAVEGSAGLAAKLLLSRLMRAGRGRITRSAFPAVQVAAAPLAAPRAAVDSLPARDHREKDKEIRRVRVPLAEIIELFAKSLGDQQAALLVNQSISRLGLLPNEITPEGAARLLDVIERTGGVAAAVARFAKVRFLLKFGK